MSSDIYSNTSTAFEVNYLLTEEPFNEEEFLKVFDIPKLIQKLLWLVHTDTSSITAKMACSAAVLCWYPLANSRYGLHALFILKDLLRIRSIVFSI